MQVLGDLLRQEREKKGLSIEQVAFATKISVSYLRALENNDYVDLPSAPFVRGFLVSYAKHLNLNSEEILQQFKTNLNSINNESEKKSKNLRGYAFEVTESEKSRATLWRWMLALGCISAMLFFAIQLSKNETNVQESASLKKLKNVKKEPQKMNAVGSVDVELAKKQEGFVLGVNGVISKKKELDLDPDIKPQDINNNSMDILEGLPDDDPVLDPLYKGDGLLPQEIKYKLIFKALEDVWVRYKVDRRPVMKFVLRKERLLVLRAASQIRAQFSNSNAVSVKQVDGVYLPLSSEQSNFKLELFNENDTILYPQIDPENRSQPFPGAGPLPLTQNP